MSDDPRRPIDELREQLKALGYLDARVNRFVLGGLTGGRRPAGFVLQASARIGAIAGILLGPAAALGVRLRAPELVAGATDAIVLALYLSLLFALAATLVAALAITAGAAIARAAAPRLELARRARLAAGFAGLVVGLVCFTYLAFWWRAASALGSGDPLGWTLVVLGVAAAIALLLGHAVSLVIVAMLARMGLARGLGPGVPLSSMRLLLPVGALAVAAAFALLIASGPAGEPASAPPDLTVVPTGVRLVVVAIDGVDLPTVERLRDAGQLPAFDALLAGSIATLPAAADRDPARVWTTIATGQPPDRHGIRRLESRQVAGLAGRLRSSERLRAITAATDLLRLTRPALASSDDRLIPAFWEVAARAGLRTAAVHWWATWPAPDGLGIVLSDRALLRLERGGPLDGEIAPASLYAELTADWRERRARAAARAADAVPAGTADQIAAVVLRSAEIDATLVDLAADAALAPADLLAVYLPGLDIAQHALLSGSNDGAASPSDLSARVAVIERYYRFLDSLLAPFVSGGDSNRLLALVTQPGRVASPSPGVLALTGPLAGQVRTTAAATAVAPTLLHALGIPIARDLASGPAMDLFAPAFAGARPPRTIASYGGRDPATRPATTQTLDREMIERMRSLGYLR